MERSRRSVLVGGVALVAGCGGRETGGSNGSPTETGRRTATTAATDCAPSGIETREGRTEYALSAYEDAYDDMNGALDEIGAVITGDGLYAAREEGPDANTPDGLILETRDGGDVLVTLTDLSGSAIADMRNDLFYDAIEAFRGAQGALDSNVDSWNEVREFVTACEVDDADLFPGPIADGIATARHLRTAAEKFEQECTVYLDNDATFDTELAEADRLQADAISALRSAAADYPRSPTSLENEVTVYRSE
ncbi:hypothetical protein [Haloarcula laminariae]|uniref:hypothetical protein n=1 Tax=Haloarcula laminariae TaxID=2961577 RepID=UPI0024071CA1|nr:hypothetical protein [Halomicroarcula sp. FL173]